MGWPRLLAVLALVSVALYRSAPLLGSAVDVVVSQLSTLATPLDPPPPPTQPQKFKHRIVGIGDLHGDLPHALRALRLAGLVDLRGKWVAKATTVVQTGDIVDRGDDTIALFRLMDRLRADAPKLGSRLVSLMGNHEFMNSMGDWRYVTKGDVATFGGERARRLAMSERGWLGRTWQAKCAPLISGSCAIADAAHSYSTTARVPYALAFQALHAPEEPADTLERFLNSPPPGQQPLLDPSSASAAEEFFATSAASFVHGGIHPSYAALGLTEINRLGASLLNRTLHDALSPVQLPPGTPEEEARFYGADGPVWYRGYALDAEDQALCDRADQAAEALGVRRLIMGHTPVFQGIVSRCQGRILIIDTGPFPRSDGF